ncbi:MAG TPA: hypothetical protein VGG82_12200 [Casimicrobiaceae bacterium]|jgi:hypothetical protein
MTVLLSGVAAAQVPADDWQFRAMIYAYLPDIRGSTTFPAGGSIINADADIVGHLKFAFMGSLEAQKGRWGAFTDVMYLDVSGTKSGTRDLTIGGGALPAGITANASMDIKGTAWTLAGNYRVMATPDAAFDAFAGARLLSVKENLGWEFSANVGSVMGPGLTGGSEVKSTTGMASSASRDVGTSERTANGSSPITSMSEPVIPISPGRESPASATRSSGEKSWEHGGISTTTSSRAAKSRA